MTSLLDTQCRLLWSMMEIMKWLRHSWVESTLSESFAANLMVDIQLACYYFHHSSDKADLMTVIFPPLLPPTPFALIYARNLGHQQWIDALDVYNKAVNAKTSTKAFNSYGLPLVIVMSGLAIVLVVLAVQYHKLQRRYRLLTNGNITYSQVTDTVNFSGEDSGMCLCPHCILFFLLLLFLLLSSWVGSFSSPPRIQTAAQTKSCR